MRSREKLEHYYVLQWSCQDGLLNVLLHQEHWEKLDLF